MTVVVDIDAVVVLLVVVLLVVVLELVLQVVVLLVVVVLVVPTAMGVPDKTETGITPQIEPPGKLRGAACVHGPDGGW
jgi:hypothetical protein